MHYTNNASILKIAIDFGCKTAKDLALFIREYNPQILISESGHPWVQLS